MQGERRTMQRCTGNPREACCLMLLVTSASSISPPRCTTARCRALQPMRTVALMQVGPPVGLHRDPPGAQWKAGPACCSACCLGLASPWSRNDTNHTAPPTTACYQALPATNHCLQRCGWWMQRTQYCTPSWCRFARCHPRRRRAWHPRRRHHGRHRRCPLSSRQLCRLRGRL